MGYITFNENCRLIQDNMQMLTSKTNIKPRGTLQILAKTDYQNYKKFRAIVTVHKTK